MNISKDLSMHIARLIEDYSAAIDEIASPELRKLVERERVLPLLSDMGGVLTIDEDGEIRSFLWDDDSPGKVEEDLRIRNVALFQGSKMYPELAELIEKLDDAIMCPYCLGSGIPPFAAELKSDVLVCYCGGLGWIPNTFAIGTE